MAAKVWKVYPKTSDDIITQLLDNRGIKTAKRKREFFNPKLKDDQKEIEIPGIKKAKERILKAVKNNELIVVYGDYDVDGLCATATLYHGLTSLGAKVLPYIPHREKEGYGLSKFGIDQVLEKGTRLIISVDCGIVANDVADYTKSKGIDLIITDHHQVGDELPNAFCIVHSTKICGTAVAWCLLRQMSAEDDAQQLLDFVAVATVCDLIPLTGINRFFVKRGLELLNRTKRVGWKALFSACSITPGSLGVFEIGFIIGPRLNALGRLEHALDALRLLCTKDLGKAYKLAQILCAANDQRKQLTLAAVEEAKDSIATLKDNKDWIERKIVVVHSKNWIPGVIGLVAGRICEEYQIATIAISEGEEFSKGSARSVNGLNIVETIRKCSSLLIDVGGHEAAAGFTIKTANLAQFKTRVEAAIPKVYQLGQSVILIDAKITVSRLSKQLVQELARFEPCGIGNPRPLLETDDIPVDEVRVVGDGKHLKLRVGGIDAIAFGKGELASQINPGNLVSVIYHLEEDFYNGNSKLQLKIKDLTLS